MTAARVEEVERERRRALYRQRFVGVNLTNNKVHIDTHAPDKRDVAALSGAEVNPSEPEAKVDASNTSAKLHIKPEETEQAGKKNKAVSKEPAKEATAEHEPGFDLTTCNKMDSSPNQSELRRKAVNAKSKLSSASTRRPSNLHPVVNDTPKTKLTTGSPDQDKTVADAESQPVEYVQDRYSPAAISRISNRVAKREIGSVDVRLVKQGCERENETLLVNYRVKDLGDEHANGTFKFDMNMPYRLLRRPMLGSQIHQQVLLFQAPKNQSPLIDVDQSKLLDITMDRNTATHLYKKLTDIVDMALQKDPIWHLLDGHENNATDSASSSDKPKREVSFGKTPESDQNEQPEVPIGNIGKNRNAQQGVAQTQKPMESDKTNDGHSNEAAKAVPSNPTSSKKKSSMVDNLEALSYATAKESFVDNTPATKQSRKKASVPVKSIVLAALIVIFSTSGYFGYEYYTASQAVSAPKQSQSPSGTTNLWEPQ